MGMNIEIKDGELFRGPAATLLVEMAQRFMQPARKRDSAVGRCERGGAFQVTTVQAPADFEQAIDEVLRPDRVPTAMMAPDVDDEKIGEEYRRQPWLW